MVNLVKKYGWHEWLVKSNFSFLIGASHPAELIFRASQLGYDSIVLNDYDGVYGNARLHHDRSRLIENQELEHVASIKHGAECHLFMDHEDPILQQDTISFVATNLEGYKNLCHLLTYAHRNGKNCATLPLDYLLKSDVNGLLAFKPMRGSYRVDGKKTRNSEYYKNHLSTIKDHFNGDFYMAVSSHLTPSDKTWIESSMAIAGSINARVVASQDIYFAHPSQKDLSDLLHAIRHNKTVANVSEHFFLNTKRSFSSLELLNRIYSSLPNFESMLKTSKELADRCTFDLSELKYRYPEEMIPQALTPNEYLEKITWQSASKVYQGSIPDKIYNQLKYELNLVIEMGFSDYFLTVYDIVEWAKRQNIVCQGRGSAANSSICYVLGITSVNPANYELLFERFINKDRKDPPDIDVDFEHERREEVLQYVYERYGRNRAAMVANVICFRAKGCLRSSGEALAIPNKLIDHASKVISTKNFRSKALQETIIAVKDDFADSNLNITDLKWSLWSRMATRLKGFPRHMGIHSGGFVISSDNLQSLSPVEPATMHGRTVLQWSKEDIEGLGFFKIDLLALGGLTLIRKCFDLLREHYEIKLVLSEIPQDDEATYSMIQKADTVGTFQIESRAQMSFLPRHKPKNFYDLVIEVAIIRPGPIQGGVIHPYLKRRDGLEPVTYPDPRLEDVLKRTYGIPIFQEQVMRIAIEVGDFTPGEANELRKNIGSFKLQERSNKWIDKLVRGMKKNNIADKYIEVVLSQIKAFASYGFPESHAASFASLAYVTSYLKCHHPTAFFTAILNSQPMGFYNVDTLIKTAAKSGVGFKPVDIIKSQWDHSLEKIDDGSYVIRLGFRIVSCLSKIGINRFIAHRDKTQWKQLSDLIKNSGFSRVDFTALAAADAFVGFGIDRRSAVWIAEAAPFCSLLEDVDDTPLFGELPEQKNVELDYESTSTSLRTHPTKIMREKSWLFRVPVKKITLSKDLKLKINQRSVMVFGMVVSRQAPPTAKGMMFFTLWDEYGSMDIIIRPTIYQRFRKIVDSQSFLCIEGVVQGGKVFQSVLVKNIIVPQASRADILPMNAGKLGYQRENELAHSRSYMC